MTRRANAQLNVRSDSARIRVAELMRETGKNATQVVEAALDAYRPARPDACDGMAWDGDLLVITAPIAQMSLDEHLGLIDRLRGEESLPDGH